MYDNKRNLYFIGLSLLFFGKQSEISTFAIQRSSLPYTLLGILPLYAKSKYYKRIKKKEWITKLNVVYPKIKFEIIALEDLIK